MASFTQFMCFFPFIPFLKIIYSRSLYFRSQLVITSISLTEENFCLLLDGQSSISCQWLTICINIKSCYHIRWRDWTTAQSSWSWLAWWQHTVCLPILQLQTNVKSANTLSMQLISRKNWCLGKLWSFRNDNLKLVLGEGEGENILTRFTGEIHLVCLLHGVFLNTGPLKDVVLMIK